MATVVQLPEDKRGQATVKMIEDIFERNAERKRQQDVHNALTAYQKELDRASTSEEVKAVQPLANRLDPMHLGDIDNLLNINKLDSEYKGKALSRVNPGSKTVYRVGQSGAIESQNIRSDAGIPAGWYPAEVFDAVLTHEQSKGVAANTDATLQSTDQNRQLFPSKLLTANSDATVAAGTVESRIAQSLADLGFTNAQTANTQEITRGNRSDNNVKERTEDVRVGQTVYNAGLTLAQQSAQELANQETRATKANRIAAENKKNQVDTELYEISELSRIAGVNANTAAVTEAQQQTKEERKRASELHEITMKTQEEAEAAALAATQAEIEYKNAKTDEAKANADKLRNNANGLSMDATTAAERAQMNQLAAWGVTPTDPANRSYIRDLYEAEKTLDESFSAQNMALDPAALAKAKAALRFRAEIEIKKPKDQRVAISEIQSRIVQNMNDTGEVQVSVPLPEGGTYTVDPQGRASELLTTDDPATINEVMTAEIVKGIQGGLKRPELDALLDQLMNQSSVKALNFQERVQLKQALYNQIAAGAQKPSPTE